MKHVQRNKIINISEDKPNTFLFEYLQTPLLVKEGLGVVHIAEELEKHKNTNLLEQVKTKPAMWSNVYSPRDELSIFEAAFEKAISSNTPVHICGITLKEELEILEKYYHEQRYFSEDINCYTPDFSKCLVTVSVNIENLMWRGSDYKRMGEAIFFNPPIRESGQVKALFKGINRGVIAGINLFSDTLSPLGGKYPKGDRGFNEKIQFLNQCITDEKILPIILAKTLKYNLEDVGMKGEVGSFEVEF